MKTSGEFHQDVAQIFALGAPDVTHWSCFRYAPGEDLKAQGERLTWDAGDGVSLREWPIADLSVETIRERFGVGVFRVGWLRVKDGKRVARGRSPAVQVHELPASVGAPTALRPAPVPMAPASGDPMGLLRDVRALARDELETVERQVSGRIDALARLAEVFVGARTVQAAPPPDPALAQVAAVLGQVVTTLDTITKRLDALEQDEDDEDEDDEEPDAIDRFVKKAERLAPLAMTVAGAVQAAQEKKQAAPAAPAPAPAPVAPAPALHGEVASS